MAVFRKEMAIEFRSRIALSALLLFMVITISTIAFTTAGERINNYVASALLWIVLFFGSMTGLSRTFVMEEERGTSLLLKLSSTPMEVFLENSCLHVFISCIIIHRFRSIPIFPTFNQCWKYRPFLDYGGIVKHMHGFSHNSDCCHYS